MVRHSHQVHENTPIVSGVKRGEHIHTDEQIEQKGTALQAARTGCSSKKQSSIKSTIFEAA
jgi:hypothetical protein